MAKSFIERTIEDVRLYLGDAASSAVFSDEEIVRQFNRALRTISQDLSRISSRPVVMRTDVSVGVGESTFVLPPHVGEVYMMGEWDADNGRFVWVVNNPSRWSVSRGGGIRINGRCLEMDRPATTATTLTIEHMPSGDFLMHQGTVDFSGLTLTTAQKEAYWWGVEAGEEEANLEFGEIDDRDNAYVGGMLRIWRKPSEMVTANLPQLVQERLVETMTLKVTGSAKQMREFTVKPDWATQISVANWHYEIVPPISEAVRHVAALRTAAGLAAVAKDMEGNRLLMQEYQQAARTERLFEATMNPEARRWVRDTRYGLLSRS